MLLVFCLTEMNWSQILSLFLLPMHGTSLWEFENLQSTNCVSCLTGFTEFAISLGRAFLIGFI